MIDINKENYFATEHRGLSQSKIKDYFKCPNYFYRKNILHKVDIKSSGAFLIGSVVDNILTEEDSIDNYAVVEGDGRIKEVKDLKKQYLEAGKKIITQDQYTQIIDIADAFFKTKAHEIIRKNYVFQEILQIEDKNLGEHFDSLIGKPDAYNILPNGTCILVDIKTSRSIDDKKFWYSFKEYGYDFQLFFYSILLKKKYPQIKSFLYFILAGETSEPYGVKMFSIPEKYIVNQENAYNYAIKNISSGHFDKDDASFENPVLLCDPRERTELLCEEEF